MTASISSLFREKILLNRPSQVNPGNVCRVWQTQGAYSFYFPIRILLNFSLFVFFLKFPFCWKWLLINQYLWDILSSNLIFYIGRLGDMFAMVGFLPGKLLRCQIFRQAIIGNKRNLYRFKVQIILKCNFKVQENYEQMSWIFY